MKSKIFPIFLVIIFFVIFFIFYKGLQNSNIYVPESKIKKDIPIFEAKTLLGMDKKKTVRRNFQKRSILFDEYLVFMVCSV